jgi:hypothetical protein
MGRVDLLFLDTTAVVATIDREGVAPRWGSCRRHVSAIGGLSFLFRIIAVNSCGAVEVDDAVEHTRLSPVR